MPHSNCKMAKYKLQNREYKIHNAKCKMQNAKYKIQNAKCKMQNTKRFSGEQVTARVSVEQAQETLTS